MDHHGSGRAHFVATVSGVYRLRSGRRMALLAGLQATPARDDGGQVRARW